MMFLFVTGITFIAGLAGFGFGYRRGYTDGKWSDVSEDEFVQLVRDGLRRYR
jgi:hypothetical protein